VLFESHDKSSPFISTHYVVLYPQNGDRMVTIDSVGATENARPENAGLENDGQNVSQLWAKLRGLENAGLENDGPC